MAKQQRTRTTRREPTSNESRAADVITSLWMLAVFTTLMCEIGSSLVLALGREQPTLALLAMILMTGALVTGTLSLALAAGVFKMRSQPPPRGITVFALVVGGMPVVIFVLTLLRSALE